MKIFISYRRDDSAGYAGRLFDHLAARFGARNIFMDIDTIQPGEDFRKAIEDAVGTCDVVLVMIGRQWVNATDPQGKRRLDDPGDFVRAEIAGALTNPQVRVIPVLVRDATMPGIHELPEDIKELSWRNAIELSDHRFPYDANKLIEVIERAWVKPARTSSGKIQNVSRSRTWGILFVILALSFAVWRLGSGVFPRTDIQASPSAAGSPVAASPAVEANELRLIRTVPPSGDVVASAFSSDGTMLALGVGYDGMIKILSTSEDTLIRRLNAGTTVLSLAFSPDNQMLAAGLVSSTVKIFRVSDGVELHTLEGLSSGVYSLAFSPNGQAFAAGAEPDILLWQVSDGAFLQKEKIEGVPARVVCLAFSPDGGILAVGLYYSDLKLWQVADGTLVYELPGGSFGVLALSPDGETLASAGQGSTVDLWRMRDGEKIHELKGHTQVVDSIAFASDSQTLVTVSEGVEVRRWQVSDGTRLYTQTLDGQNIRLTLLSGDSRMLMAAYSDGTVKLWSIP